MAQASLTEEEIVFRRRARRRLVGAVVLVVIAVAVVPMILPEKRPQQDTQQIDIRIPSQDASGYAPKIVAAPAPITPASAVTPVETQAAPAIEPVPPLKVEAPKPEPKPEAPEPVKPAPAVEKAAPAKAPVAKPTEAPAKLAADSKQTYFVQYGAFSEMKNAKQKQAELKAKGINTFTEVVKTSGGDKIRVRSGPYAARDLAEKVRVKVKPLDSKLVVVGANG